MISFRANIVEPLVLTLGGGAPDETWALTRIQTLAGVVVGADVEGAALEYPVPLTQVEGLSVWSSPPLLVTDPGKYVVVLTSSRGRVHTDVMDVGTSFTFSPVSASPSSSQYATVQDMVTRYGAEELAQLGDQAIPRTVTGDMLIAALSGDMSAFSEEEQAATSAALQVISTALLDATTLIEGHLRGRYALPLVSVPVTLTRWGCDIARYDLYRSGETDFIKDRYETALKQLRLVAEGKLDLGLDPQQSPAPVSAAIIVTRGADRVFSPAALRDYQ